jgi:hypothetical protein
LDKWCSLTLMPERICIGSKRGGLQFQLCLR